MFLNRYQYTKFNISTSSFLALPFCVLFEASIMQAAHQVFSTSCCLQMSAAACFPFSPLFFCPLDDCHACDNKTPTQFFCCGISDCRDQAVKVKRVCSRSVFFFIFIFFFFHGRFVVFLCIVASGVAVGRLAAEQLDVEDALRACVDWELLTGPDMYDSVLCFTSNIYNKYLCVLFLLIYCLCVLGITRRS